MIRTIAIRILVLALIITAIELIYRHTSYQEDLFNESTLYTYVQKDQYAADVLYFGESSDFSYSEKDSLKTPVSEFTSRFFPAVKFKAITHGALHAGIYKTLLRTIDKESKAKIMVVTMNLRSFNADWIYSKLETPLQKTTVLYQPGLASVNRFLLSLNAFDNKTEEERREEMYAQWDRDTLRFPYDFPYKTVKEWDMAKANGGWLNPDGSWDMPKIELSCHFIKNYAFQIDTSANPRIKDFNEIVEMAKEKNLKLVFHLLAENMEYADSLVGKDLTFLMRQNRDLLVKYYTAKGVIVADNLETVKGTDFMDQNWTTEHYLQNGRQAVAKNLAQALKIHLPGRYYEAW